MPGAREGAVCGQVPGCDRVSWRYHERQVSRHESCTYLVWKRSRIHKSKSHQSGQSSVEQYGGEDVSSTEVVGKSASPHRDHGEVRRESARGRRVCPAVAEELSADLLEQSAPGAAGAKRRQV